MSLSLVTTRASLVVIKDMRNAKLSLAVCLDQLVTVISQHLITALLTTQQQEARLSQLAIVSIRYHLYCKLTDIVRSHTLLTTPDPEHWLLKDMGLTPCECTSCAGRWSAWGRRKPLVPTQETARPKCWGHCPHHRTAPPPRWCHPPERGRSPRKAPPPPVSRQAARDTPRSSWRRSGSLRKKTKKRH